MEHNTVFRVIYTGILGVVIALFFGIGIAAFYEAPKPPDYYSDVPTTYKTAEPTDEEQRAMQLRDQKLQASMKAYDEQHKQYERTVSILLLFCAIVSIAVAFAVAKPLGFLSDGVLLGGLFTLLHGLIRGFSADDNKYLFVAVCVSVVVVLYLGYRRFLIHAPAQQKRKK